MNFSAFLLQVVPPAPGGGDAPAPQPVQGTTTAPGAPGTGPAHGPPAAGPAGLAGMFPLLLLVPMIIAMFWMQSKQQKKQKELEDSLKTGDRVVTQSGLIGKLTDKGNRYVKVEIAPGIKVQMLRTAIVARDTGEETPASDKDKSDDKKGDDKASISPKKGDDAKSEEKSGKSSKSDDKARAKSESASK